MGRWRWFAVVAGAATLVAMPTAPSSAQVDTMSAIEIRIVDEIGDVGAGASMALDEDGFPVIAYYDATNGDLKVAHCADPLCDEPQTPRIVADAGDVGASPSLALDSAGFPVIAYVNMTTGALELVHCVDRACEAPVTAVVIDSSGETPSLRLDGANLPVVAYTDVSVDVLKLVHCDDERCEGETPVTLDSAGGLEPSLALDSAGNPVVSYYGPDRGSGSGSGLGALMLAMCDDVGCDDVSVSKIDGSGDLGRGSSLALDETDRRSIAYYNGTDGGFGGLAVQAIGTRFHIETGVRVGPQISLALAADGDVVIASYGTDPGGLFISRCDDPLSQEQSIYRLGDDDCQPRSVTDGIVSIGSPSALQVGDDDRPVVAFRDLADGDLKLARCANPSCMSDGDGDGVVDEADNCVSIVNPDQADLDLDGVGDACDDDADGDGQLDVVERACGSDPFDPASLAPDADGDGLPDCLEDSDGDGQLDVVERACGSDPFDPASVAPDSDGDGVPDCIAGAPPTTLAPTLPATGVDRLRIALMAGVLSSAGLTLLGIARRRAMRP